MSHYSRAAWRERKIEKCGCWISPPCSSVLAVARLGCVIINRRHNSDPAAASVREKRRAKWSTGSMFLLPPTHTRLTCGSANRQLARLGVCLWRPGCVLHHHHYHHLPLSYSCVLYGLILYKKARKATPRYDKLPRSPVQVISQGWR